jgi:ABC-type bacteriocin/lantibiotic exporter with double-glycine peptidase domain
MSVQDATGYVHADGYGHSTAEDLVMGLERIGLNAATLHISDIRGCRAKAIGPFIAHLRQGHFVVVMVTSNLRVILMDGAGASVISAEEFRQIWSGYIIVVGRTPDELAGALKRIGAS